MLGHSLQSMAQTKKLGNTAVITLRNRMDLFNAPLLMVEFDNLIENGITDFIVDLTVVRVVDADGDYPLLHLLKRAQSVGGNVTLVCPPGNPIRIFYEMMRLNTLFNIVDTRDAVSGLA